MLHVVASDDSSDEDDERAGEEVAQLPRRVAPPSLYPDEEPDEEEAAAYPDTDGQFGGGAEGDDDDDDDEAAEAYPDTDAQFGGGAEAYPDTDAQFGGGAEGGDDDEADAYPDGIDAQPSPAPQPPSQPVPAPAQSTAPHPHVGALAPKLGEKPVGLQEGDTVRFGDSTHVFRLTGLSTALPDKFHPPVWAGLPSKTVELEIIDTSRPPNPYLDHLTAEGQATGAEVLAITNRKCFVLGRNAQLADIVCKHESVSRQHCAIIHDEDATYVVDCGSASGTFLNNEDVGPQPRKVGNGQILSLGSAPITYTFRFGGRKDADAAKGQKRARPPPPGRTPGSNQAPHEGSHL
ncbi:hypothetical protein T492DRAFT_1146870 [Pavlovales sp. CCMP2436]|nr:hypothetical protein T492DRAFT_1146870 [Pavlovales sp. CCMP2436]